MGHPDGAGTRTVEFDLTLGVGPIACLVDALTLSRRRR